MRHSIPLLSLACLILFAIHRSRGHSNGAPEGSCDSLTVTHMHLGNPVTGSPCGPPCRSHQLRLMGSSADSFTYNCSQTYQLQLTLDRVVGMNPQESLNGYMVAPREDTGTPLGPDVDYVGSWEMGTDMKLICDGQAVTQSKVLVDTVAVNMTWKAPMNGFQKVAFWFVVVPSTAFYYLPVKSLTATPNLDGCSCPPGQCAVNATTDPVCIVPNNSLCIPGEVFDEIECQCQNCTLSIFCMNGGVLNASTCTCDCPAVYSGPLCENCTRMCENGGTLDMENCTCNCTGGFSGDNCERSISLRPDYGNIYGGTPVQVILRGAILEPTDTVSCVFGDRPAAPGMRINATCALCPSPPRLPTGYMSFTIVVTRMDNQTAFMVQSRFLGIAASNSHEVDVLDATADLGDDLLLYEGKNISINWPVDILKYQEFSTYTVDVKILEVNFSAFTFDEYILATGMNNTGKLEVQMPKLNASNMYDIAATLFQVSVNPTHLSAGLYRVAMWSELFLVFTNTSLNFRDQCLSWYKQEAEGIGEMLLNRVLPCPPTEDRVRLPNSGLQLQDFLSRIGSTNYHEQFLKFFHPGAARCYEQTQKVIGASQECCYNDIGNLVVGSSAGGSVDKNGTGTEASIESHIVNDLFPYVYCCKGEFLDCAKYYERRPSDNGNRFTPPVPACVYGDPHIVTLDGHKYTFNGKGEYILIQTGGDRFTLQGRMEETSTVNNTLARATVFTALAVRQNDSSTVEFRLEDELYLVIDGVEERLEDFDKKPYTNVVVKREANSSFSATFSSSGAFVEVRAVDGEVLPDYISAVIVSLPDNFQGKTSGLMGNYNGDTSDDLIPQSGEDPLQLNTSLETLHWDFGVTWIISNVAESLFTYENSGPSFGELYDRNFTPVFEPIFSSQELEATAEVMCEGDVFCLYDIAATGDTTIGLTTLNGGQELVMITNSSQPVLCNPPCANGACVDNNTCSCSEGYQGDRCTDAVFTPCPMDVCNNVGNCTQLAGTYMCSCYEGYSGPVCELCIRMCQNGGILDNETCVCGCAGGFSGDNCETCNRMCQNGGTFDNRTCTCDCTDGFSGADCENCTRMCQNGGILFEGNCTCDCAVSFSGDNCETCIRMCQNGGTLDEGNCTCNCAGGFSGPNCETCPLTCQNGGTLSTGTCTCDCADGYSGDNCTSCIRECQNGGALDEGSCTCDCAGGFSGPNCETCPLTCENEGSLNGSTCTCDCTDGYSGTTCGTCSRTCQNGGTLDAGACMCTCINGFSGSSCETCSLNCQNGGTLNIGTCTCGCADGYSGATCGNCSRVCHNEGILNEGTCMCDCVGSFSGSSCEVRPADSSTLVVPLVIGLVGGIIIIGAIAAVAIMLVWIYKAKFRKSNSASVELTEDRENTWLERNPLYEDADPSKPTTESQCKEDGGDDTSSDVRVENFPSEETGI